MKELINLKVYNGLTQLGYEKSHLDFRYTVCYENFWNIILFTISYTYGSL